MIKSLYHIKNSMGIFKNSKKNMFMKSEDIKYVRLHTFDYIKLCIAT